MHSIILSVQYLPDWLPGTGFKQVALKYRKSLDLVADTPLAFTKAQMVRYAIVVHPA